MQKDNVIYRQSAIEIIQNCGNEIYAYRVQMLNWRTKEQKEDIDGAKLYFPKELNEGGT